MGGDLPAGSGGDPLHRGTGSVTGWFGQMTAGRTLCLYSEVLSPPTPQPVQGLRDRPAAASVTMAFRCWWQALPFCRLLSATQSGLSPGAAGLAFPPALSLPAPLRAGLLGLPVSAPSGVGLLVWVSRAGRAGHGPPHLGVLGGGHLQPLPRRPAVRCGASWKLCRGAGCVWQ